MPPIDKILEQVGEGTTVAGRPFVTLTYAQSLDGSISLMRGRSLAVSGAESLKMTHQLRGSHDAIMVGIGTLLVDDPRLTARNRKGNNPQPVVLDSRLRTPLTARMWENDLPPWIFTTITDGIEHRAIEGKGGQVFCVARGINGGVELGQVLGKLTDLGIKRLMVEGGARVINSFIESRLVDLVIITISPYFAGGLKAVENLVGPRDASRLAGSKFPRLEELESGRLGEDLVVWGRIKK